MAKTKKAATTKIKITLPHEQEFRTYLQKETNVNSYNSYVNYVKKAFIIYYVGCLSNKNKNKDLNIDTYFSNIVNSETNNIKSLCDIYKGIHDDPKIFNKYNITNPCSGLMKYIRFVDSNINNNSTLSDEIIKLLEESRTLNKKDIEDCFYKRLNSQDRFTDKCWFPIGLLTNNVCKNLVSKTNCGHKMSDILREEIQNIFFIGEYKKQIYYIKLSLIDKLTFNGKGGATFTTKYASGKTTTYRLCSESGRYHDHVEIHVSKGAFNIASLHIDHDPEISVVLSKSIWPRLRILKAEILKALNGVALSSNDGTRDAQLKSVVKNWNTNGYPQIPYLLDEIKDLHDCMTLTVIDKTDNLQKNSQTSVNRNNTMSANEENINSDSEEESLNVKEKIASSVSPDNIDLDLLYKILEASK